MELTSSKLEALAAAAAGFAKDGRIASSLAEGRLPDTQLIGHTLFTQYNLPFYFGGTGLLIVVGVSLDTVAQIESQLLTRHYDGLSGPTGGPRAGRRSMAPTGMPG